MTRRLLAIGVVLALLCAATGAAAARTTGTAQPASDCRGWGLTGIDQCRRRDDRLAPMTLPSNWHRLNADEQLLVLIDLERVNWGLAPIKVLLRSLNSLAERGAERATDPGFPAEGGRHGYFRGGGIYAMAIPPSTTEADFLWMYQDAGSGWAHRDNILMPGSDLVAGAGATPHSWAMEMLNGFHYRASDVTFTWSAELKYFSRRPGLAPA